MIYAAHHIPGNIGRLCVERKKTCAHLASELEVSRVFIGKIMAGDKTPSLARMLEIARFFGVTPNELLGASE
jgi:transcriptional regulator with XRE-family HTH domain